MIGRPSSTQACGLQTLHSPATYYVMTAQEWLCTRTEMRTVRKSGYAPEPKCAPCAEWLCTRTEMRTVRRSGYAPEPKCAPCAECLIPTRNRNPILWSTGPTLVTILPEVFGSGTFQVCCQKRKHLRICDYPVRSKLANLPGLDRVWKTFTGRAS
jgi:hypothetical protein